MPVETLIFCTTRSFGPDGKNGTSTSSATSNAPALPFAFATTRSFAPPTGMFAFARNTSVSARPSSILIEPLSLPENASGAAAFFGCARPAIGITWLPS